MSSSSPPTTTGSACSTAPQGGSPRSTRNEAALPLLTDGRESVVVPVSWAETQLDHGCAVNCHKAQGATVDFALLYGAGGLTSEAGYVALSPGLAANHLYLPETDHRGPSRAAVATSTGLLLGLPRRRAQTLATRQLPGEAAAGVCPEDMMPTTDEPRMSQ